MLRFGLFFLAATFCLLATSCWAAPPRFELLQSKTDPSLYLLAIADDDDGFRLLPLAAGLRRIKLQRSEAVCTEEAGCTSKVSLLAEFSTRCSVEPNGAILGKDAECPATIGYEGSTPEAEAQLLAILKELKAIHRLWLAASFNLVQQAAAPAPPAVGDSKEQPLPTASISAGK